eukprot:5640578-Pleurochrysis_carterae.AAC.1
MTLGLPITRPLQTIRSMHHTKSQLPQIYCVSIKESGSSSNKSVSSSLSTQSTGRTWSKVSWTQPSQSSQARGSKQAACRYPPCSAFPPLELRPKSRATRRTSGVLSALGALLGVPLLVHASAGAAAPSFLRMELGVAACESHPLLAMARVALRHSSH